MYYVIARCPGRSWPSVGYTANEHLAETFRGSHNAKVIESDLPLAPGIVEIKQAGALPAYTGGPMHTSQWARTCAALLALVP